MLLNLSLKRFSLLNGATSKLILINSSTSSSLIVKNKLISSFSLKNCYSFINIGTRFSLVLGNTNSRLNTYSQIINKRREMSTTNVNLKLVQSYDSIIKSEQDQRSYRGLLLDNGMKCLLISDPETDRSAASVDVHAGYMLDPKEFPGLAHFCEHMLFMGSKKYPEENKFFKFIENHAGYTNAYTAKENTNYHFEVTTENFKEALDIFAQFFITPTFDASSVDREIKAVDSENQNNLLSDLWRLDQLNKSTCKPDHPYSKFGTGNLTTLKTEPEKLGLNVKDELIKFHNKYYSANLMTLCMLGKESLEELQEYAVEIFSPIPNKNLNKIDFDPNPFGRGTLMDVYYVVPVQDLRQLRLDWVIPDYRDHYETSTDQCVSYLVGHESSGSLLSELKRKGWCNIIYAGSTREARGFQFFNIVADLTKEGGENVEEILKLTFQYINMVKREKAKKWIFDEMNDLGKISFTFMDKGKPINYVMSVSTDLHVYSMDRILSGKYYQTKFDAQLIESIFEYLAPEKMKVTVVSKKYEGKTDLTEKWYGTQYKREKLSKSTVNALRSCKYKDEAFKLPLENKFIPRNLNLVKHEEDTNQFSLPRMIKNDQLTRVWFKEDTTFLLPKTVIKFELRNPLAYFDPLHSNLSNLYVDLLNDSLNEYVYSATLADLTYSLDKTDVGIELSFYGFNDKLCSFVEEIFQKILSYKVNPKRFDIIKELYQRVLLNFEAKQPYRHSTYYLKKLTRDTMWTYKELLETIDYVNIDNLEHFISKFLSQGLFVESLFYGNILKKDSISLQNKLISKLKSTYNDKILPLQPSMNTDFRYVQLKDSSKHIYTVENKVHETKSIEVFFQTGLKNSRANVLAELYHEMVKEKFFNTLRTKEQLGYIVYSCVGSFVGVQGLSFIIQSNKSPDYLDERIEIFLESVNEQIRNEMSDEDFKVYVNSLINEKLEEPKNLSNQGNIYWNEITSKNNNFDRMRIEVDELRKLNKNDVIEFFEAFISHEAPGRRKLAVYIAPEVEVKRINENESIKKSLIKDVNEWKMEHSLYPPPKSMIDLNREI